MGRFAMGVTMTMKNYHVVRGGAAGVIVSSVLLAGAGVAGTQQRAPDADPGASMTLAAPPPAFDDRTVVLFDGRSWGQWRTLKGEPSAWQVQSDGSVLVSGGDAVSAEEFGDFQLHLEFRCGAEPGGQRKGNSGVYIHGRYEVQVYDTFGMEPTLNSCGAVYGIAPPAVNAARPAGEWQTYDIVFRAPRFNGERKLLRPARLTVFHNGVLVQDAVELTGHTAHKARPPYQAHPGKLPLSLQDHGHPVRFRNIWIRELAD